MAGGGGPVGADRVHVLGGPVGTDRVHVLKVGPDTARTVPVMVPGMFGAANDFRRAARDLVAAVPGVQVWAFDRREENLADRSGFRTADPAAYYLDGHYRTQDPAASAFAAGWCSEAGHSWGATTAMAYAAWDFDGCPGYRDVAALVLVDGGVRGAFDGTGEPVADSPEQVKERLAAIEGGAVFDMTLSAVGLGDRAESTQIWYQLAGWYAHRDPDGPSVLQPRMPDALRPPVPVTNAGLPGTLVDAGVGWPNDISVHSGHQADSGEPRGWVDAGITPPSTGSPRRTRAAPNRPYGSGSGRPGCRSTSTSPTPTPTRPARLACGWRHAAGLDVPLYAFRTSYAKGTIVSAAREVVADSRVPYAAYETDNGMNHLDPLFAAPQHGTRSRRHLGLGRAVEHHRTGPGDHRRAERGPQALRSSPSRSVHCRSTRSSSPSTCISYSFPRAFSKGR